MARLLMLMLRRIIYCIIFCLIVLVAYAVWSYHQPEHKHPNYAEIFKQTDDSVR